MSYTNLSATNLKQNIIKVWGTTCQGFAPNIDFKGATRNAKCAIYRKFWGKSNGSYPGVRSTLYLGESPPVPPPSASSSR